MKYQFTYILLITSFVCFGTSTKVTRIIDGDTFEIETGEKVRLIGINAPEISDVFGQEAKKHLSYLIDGKIIELQNDNVSKDRDQYSRLLRYITLNGTDINKQMILDGYAFAYLKYRFDKADEYKHAQLTASHNNNGMWGNEKSQEVRKRQESKDWNYHLFSLKVLIVGSMVILLMAIGIYHYFKKS